MARARERIRERKIPVPLGPLEMTEESRLERINTIDIPTLPIHILRSIDKGIKPTFAFMMYYDRANNKFRFQEEAISAGAGAEGPRRGANSAQTETTMGAVWTLIVAARADRIGMFVSHVTDSSAISISYNATGVDSYRKLPGVLFQLNNYTGAFWGISNTYRVHEWW